MKGVIRMYMRSCDTCIRLDVMQRSVTLAPKASPVRTRHSFVGLGEKNGCDCVVFTVLVQTIASMMNAVLTYDDN